MSELKPCPFCGGEAVVIDPRLRSYFETLENATMRVACPDCGAGIRFGYLNERWDKLTEEQAKEAIRATISAWNRRARPANEPLTLEQLREMYDEPVWVVCGIYADWRIPEFIDEGGYKGFIKFTDRSAEPISDYGKNWIVYRRKPEGRNDAIQDK